MANSGLSTPEKGLACSAAPRNLRAHGAGGRVLGWDPAWLSELRQMLTTSRYHVAGLRSRVPGIGSGSWEFRSAAVRTGLMKSA